MCIEFSKLSGSGNDFIIIDNMDLRINSDDFRRYVPVICKRRICVGADGVILVEPSSKADFKWRFFNSDGSEAEMCGNGGRCVARFVYEKGIVRKRLISFETLAGIIKAEVRGRSVKIQLTPPYGMILDESLDLDTTEIEFSFVNTGVPHVVIFVDELEKIDVHGLGRGIRFHKRFSPEGTNVNFVCIKDGKIYYRTYERGVEDETLACGTGAVACAVVAAEKGLIRLPADVVTRSGEVLRIYREKENIFLEGLTKWIYDGVLKDEAFE